MDILLVMGIGILVGRFLIPQKIKKWNQRISLACTLLLIFSMGAMLSRREGFLRELSALGFTSFVFFLIPTLLSILAVYVLTRRFLEKKKARSGGEELRE